MKEPKKYYYSDELNDDFASNNIETKKLDENFVYVNNNVFYKIGAFIVYRLIATPLTRLYVKIKYHQRFRNKKVLKQAKNDSYYIFGNHTNGDLDAFVPTMLTFPKKSYIIVNPDATSIPGIKTIVKMLGGIPVPNNGMGLYKKYLEAINYRASQKGNVIAIYPEAHIWPYYTDIRPFGKQSFHYPVDKNKPCFAFTNIYVKRKLSFIKRPKVVTYVDGPFYPDIYLPKPARVQKLRDDIYNAMKERVNSNPKYNYCEYIYVDDESKSNKMK